MTFTKTHLLARLTLYSVNFFTRDKKPIILSKKKWTKNNLKSKNISDFIILRHTHARLPVLFIYLFWFLDLNTKILREKQHTATGLWQDSSQPLFIFLLSWRVSSFSWFWRSTKNISENFQSNNLKKNLFEKIFRFVQIFDSFLLKFANILCHWLKIGK